MKKLRLVFAAAIAITTFAASAQINQTPITGNGNQLVMPASKASAAQGSMYANETFLPAKLSNNATTVLVRYNAYSDYFEMNNPQDQQVKVLPKQPGVTITLVNNGAEYGFFTFSKDKKEVSGYLNIVSNNPKVKIFKREHIFLQPASTSQNSYQAAKPATYRREDDDFYVQINEGPIEYFSNKKTFAKFVPAKSKEILDYIKQNNIELEDAADLQKLADYTASLL